MGKQREMKELATPWTELQFEAVLRINALHTGCCKNNCSYRNLSPKVTKASYKVLKHSLYKWMSEFRHVSCIQASKLMA